MSSLAGFFAGLKPQLRTEVLMTGPENVMKATQIALLVYCVLWHTRLFTSGNPFLFPPDHQSRDIGNLEKKALIFWKIFA